MRRRYRQSGWIALGLLASASAQGAVLVGYELGREAPDPVLTVVRLGDGQGAIRIEDANTGVVLSTCAGERCAVAAARGTPLRLVATPDGTSVFGGWAQLPMRTPPALRNVLGDPLARCGPDGDGDILVCNTQLVSNAEVGVAFDPPPDKVEVTWALPTAVDDYIEPALQPMPAPLPVAPAPPPAVSPKVTPPKPPPPPPIEAERLDSDRPVPVIAPPPPKPVELVIKPPPPPEPPPEPAKMMPLPPNMRMVEVTDTNEVEKAPDDATHLSDKNRDVAVESAATETNLEKEMKGTEVASIESSDTTSPEIGGPDDSIHQLETTDPTVTKPVETSDHSGEASTATGAIVGEGGDGGEAGTGPEAPGGMLAMRDLGGRGSLLDRARGDGKRPGERKAPGVGARLQLDDYARLVGQDKADAERELAARKASARKGRWERKFEAVKSALENFTPDIRPGNQTALKTRAHPFAVYVARMHRRIHELWGFGFLVALDDKGADHKLNDFELWTNLEIALNPDGSIYKTTIAHTSGSTEFDVAAVDTMMTAAASFGATPEEIRSVDQRVYLRWAFYRNWRQCGTFNVEPYILTEIPGGIVPIEEGADAAPIRGTATVTPDAEGQGVEHASSTVTDETARFVAEQWLAGYATADVGKMVTFSSLPFTVGGEIAAETPAALTEQYKQLIGEAGALRDRSLLTAAEYRAKTGAEATLPDGALVLLVRTTSESFALVLVKVGAEYRVAALAR